MNLKKYSFQIAIVLFVVILASFISFEVGFNYGEEEGIRKATPDEDLNLSLFWEAYHALEEKYAHSQDFDAKEMVYGAIRGMVESLGDPYTIFFDPEEAKIFEEDVKGVFEGIGAEIGIRDDQLTIIAPLENTPAQRAGLLAGDKILKIDDTSTLNLTVDQAVQLIRGPKGTEVILTISREDRDQLKEITIKRGVIEIPSLKWEIKEENVAYIKLYQFSGNAGWDFRSAAQEIIHSPAEKIILDLRNNPGGYLEIAQEISGWFLEKGQIVAIEDFGGNQEQKIYKSKGPSDLESYPIVILINQGSASGSEILAAALRDNRGIKLIGEKSFGKGTVQELESLEEGSLKITIASWLTPNGEIITDRGLEPDIEVELTTEDFNTGKDPQIDKAVEILKEM